MFVDAFVLKMVCMFQLLLRQLSWNERCKCDSFLKQ